MNTFIGPPLFHELEVLQPLGDAFIWNTNIKYHKILAAFSTLLVALLETLLIINFTGSWDCANNQWLCQTESWRSQEGGWSKWSCAGSFILLASRLCFKLYNWQLVTMSSLSNYVNNLYLQFPPRCISSSPYSYIVLIYSMGHPSSHAAPALESYSQLCPFLPIPQD